jgi:hypothetical protein
MATSKSPNGKWIAGAFVFSGRRNPTWVIPGRVALTLLSMWDGASLFSGKAPEPAPLGYRGAFLRDFEGREWTAYGGAIVHHSGTATETRADPERRFEKLLLSTAPTGALPPVQF